MDLYFSWLSQLVRSPFAASAHQLCPFCSSHYEQQDEQPIILLPFSTK
jgi:hypothetical protein